MINEDNFIVLDSELTETHRTQGLGEVEVAKRLYNGFLIAYGPLQAGHNEWGIFAVDVYQICLGKMAPQLIQNIKIDQVMPIWYIDDDEVTVMDSNHILHAVPLSVLSNND